MQEFTSQQSTSGLGRKPQERTGRAVVLGAGLAGLTAATALAHRSEQVTVVDRDALPRVDEARAGVPQGRHIHLLVPAGRAAIERLLPGFGDELRAAGAQDLNEPQDFAIHLGGGRLKLHSLDPAFVLIGATRPLIEGLVRERLRSFENVEIVSGLEAIGLTAGAPGSVTGARVRPKGRPSAEETLPADLVVDATGRGSRAPRWMEELGYEAPHEETVRIDVRYTTRMFRRRTGSSTGARNVLIGAVPGEGRGGTAVAVEEDHWIVTLNGMQGQQPPGELSAFRDYARSLPSGDIHAIAGHEEPVGEAVTYALSANRRRRFDRLRRSPTGFVVLGDALSSFNPAYGQGMSVAALEAEALAGALDHQGPAGVARSFYRMAQPIIDGAWSQAVDNDLLHPGVDGPRTLRWRLTNAYMGRLLPVAHRDPVVGRAFLEVMGMLAPAPSLLRPGVAARVLLGRGKRKGKYAPAGSS